jgi:hypothetical protein
MKHLIFALLIVLCITTLGFGREWRPFVGAAIREDIVIAEQHIRGYNDAMIAPAYYPLGAQVTIGLTSDHLMGYLAYYDGHSTTIGTSRWDVKQMIIGGRWHPAGIGDRPFHAFVGGGVTVTTSRSDVSSAGLAASRNDLGAMLEFGLQIPVTNAVGIDFATQLHRFETEFDAVHIFGNPHYVVLAPAFQLGVQVLGPKVL